MTVNAELLQRLKSAAPDKRRRLLTNDVLELVVRFLDFDSDEKIYPDESFLDLGFNSLKAVDFKILLEARLDCNLSATVLFDCATPAALVDYLLGVLTTGASSDGFTGPQHAPSPGTTKRAELPADLEQLPKQQLAQMLRQEHARLRSLENAATEPLAIVAMACRFPGGSRDTASYWDLLESGRDGIEEVPASRWDINDYFDEDPEAPGRMYTRWGGFLADIGSFDASFFGISPREARALDPAQRLLLEVTWKALESGSIAPDSLSGSPTGVFIGTRGADYFQGHSDWRPEDATRYYATGNATSTLAGRLSYHLNLTGPAFALDTACSSSLVALHQAALSLRRGECSAAIVGAANVLLDPFGTIAICKAQMLSADGRCKAFDASADGYVRSEGCGVIVLKRLSRAQADGDQVLALVRGSAVNQDGASAGLTVPSSAAQEAVIRQALANAQLEPDSIDYIEAHGTGTSLGDPIEVAALDAVFGTKTRTGHLPVGTVKTQIGHLEPAAGIAGLIRVVLAMGHQKLTPNLHFKKPNPHIPWDATVVSVLDQSHPWPRSKARPRRAGINSFGFSGTNAHVVLEEAPAAQQPSMQPNDKALPALLPISAKSPAALAQLTSRFAEFLSSSKTPFAQVAQSAAGARGHHAFRHAVLATTNAEAQDKLAALKSSDFESRVPATSPRIAFLFTGQGSQYAEMGSEFYSQSPVFREAFDAAAAAIQAASPIDLHNEIFRQPDRLDETHITQPALFAIEYALTKLWNALGVQPAYVLGHSVGEYAAACAAGVLELEDAARLITARGALMVELTEPGAMLAVLSSPSVVEPLCQQISAKLAIAAMNCDARVSVSGPPEAIAQLAGLLDKQGERYERLQVTRAFHSPMMDPMLAPFRDVATSIDFHAPEISFVSTLDTSCSFGPGSSIETADYWVRHVREPVRFLDAMRVLEQEGVDILIEVGPSPHLLGLARRFISNEMVRFLPSMRPKRSEWSELLTSLAQLYSLGVPVTWDAQATGNSAPHLALPVYPFQRQRFWLEPRTGKLAAAQTDLGNLLGQRLDLAHLEADEALFSAQLAANDSSPLRDHCVAGQALFPAAGYLALMAAAAIETGRGPNGCVTIRSLKITAALPLGTQGVRMETHVEPGTGLAGEAVVKIHATALDSTNASRIWRLHASAQLVPSERERPDQEITPKSKHLGRQVTQKELYAKLSGLGLEYGPEYRTVRELHVGQSECIAKIQATGTSPLAGDLIDPAILDACFQSTTFVVPEELSNTPMLPLGIDHFELWSALSGTLYCHAKLVEHNERVVVVNLAITDENATPIASIEGLRLLATDRATLLSIGNPLEGLAFTREWPARPLASEERSQSTAAIGERLVWILGMQNAAQLGHEIVQQLEAAGARTQTLGASELAAALKEERPTDLLDLNWLRNGAAPSDLADPTSVAPAIESLLNALDKLSGARPRIWLVTQGANFEITDLAGSAALGIARAVELEQPNLRLSVLDLDPLRMEANELVKELLASGPEREVAWRNGQRHVARMTAGAASQVVQLEIPEHKPWRLGTKRFGSFDQLELLACEVPAPGPDEVQIEVEAAALNFKDVLFALGLLKEHTGITRALEQPLGHECAGRIVGLGSQVSQRAGLSIGQAVFCSTPSAMQSLVTVPASSVVPKPSNLSMAEAAGLPTVFLTVLYALGQVTRLKRGERILIHAAAGGVGQAALQVARRAGAEVYATASRGKWSYLKSQGVKHLFDSRSLSYTEEILKATGGQGVDVVLDSMADEHVPASLDALGENGRFIELGKLGVWSAEQMQAKRPDVSYALFDMADVLGANPGLQHELLEELVLGFESGDFTPPPTRGFPLVQAENAFRHLAGARNIGKVALDFPTKTESNEPQGILRKDSAFVVTGGLGALGMHVADWLGRHAAAEVLLLGRSAPDAQSAQRLEELQRRYEKTRFRTQATDVTDAGGLHDALRSVTHPLRGVLHAAGQLDDGLVADLSWARFESVLAPKWTGAWNLHRETLELELDFFVLFSSMTAMVGAAGQVNYAAANAGLDSLASWRQSQGLPALSIAWGPWAGGGMATRANAASALELAGIGSLSPEVGLATLEALLKLKASAPAVGVLAVDWDRYLARRGPLPLFDRLLSKRSLSPEPTEAVDLATVAPSDRKVVIQGLITKELATVLGFGSSRDVDTSLPFSELGVDSLLAVDLRNRLELAFGFELPVTLLFDHDNLDSLIEHLVKTLESPSETAAETEDEAQLREEIENLSDEEVERLLAEEEPMPGDFNG